MINESIQALNKNFDMLSIEIKNLKEIETKNNFNKVENNISSTEKGKRDILDLIMIKYENNLSFESEF